MRHLETSVWKIGPYEVQYKHVSKRVVIWRGHRVRVYRLRKRDRRSKRGAG